MNEHDSGAIGGAILARGGDGATLAYHKTPGKCPGVVFLHGLHSDMGGGKALALEGLCRRRGHAFVRFDMYGHGQSSGDMAVATIGRWVEDTLAVLDQLTEGPQILVGSSMGGWVGLRAALERRSRVKALVGVAAAPDFTEDLLWREFSPDQRAELLRNGFVDLPDCDGLDRPFRIGRPLIEEGRNHLLLVDRIGLDCPVRLIQGQQDQDVPWQTALRTADALDSADVEVILVKDGDHRLSRDQDLARLLRVVETLLEQD